MLLLEKKIKYFRNLTFEDTLFFNEIPSLKTNLNISQGIYLFKYFRDLRSKNSNFFCFKEIRKFFKEYNPLELFVSLLPYRRNTFYMEQYLNSLLFVKQKYLLKIKKKTFKMRKKRKILEKDQLSRFNSFFSYFFKYMLTHVNIFRFFKFKRIIVSDVSHYMVSLNRAAFASLIKTMFIKFLSNLIHIATTPRVFGILRNSKFLILSQKKLLVSYMLYYWRFFKYYKYMCYKRIHTKLKKKKEKRIFLRQQKKLLALKQMQKLKRFFQTIFFRLKRKKNFKRKKKFLAKVKIRKTFSFASIYKTHLRSLFIFMNFQKK